MATLLLIRGLPGSGKSTLAREYKARNGYKHYEADMFFGRGSNYKFDPLRIQEAHAWCLKNTKKALEKGLSVVVANTFSQKWEMEKYIELAFQLECEILIETATGRYESIHNVPQGVIDAMERRWEY